MGDLHKPHNVDPDRIAAFWPGIELQAQMSQLGCSCTVIAEGAEQDAYCVEHGDRVIMLGTMVNLVREGRDQGHGPVMETEVYDALHEALGICDDHDGERDYCTDVTNAVMVAVRRVMGIEVSDG